MKNEIELQACLAAGLSVLGLKLPFEAQQKLLQYTNLLHRWNQVHNLTAASTLQEIIQKHVLDSLSVLPFLQGPRILDVGTGAGLPGIPLAIAQPAFKFVLLDSRQKRINFVQTVIISLQLKNVEVVCERVEQYQPSEDFDEIISRAFSSVDQFVASSGRVCKKQGRLLAMQGECAIKEGIALDQGYVLKQIIPLVVPGFLHRNLIIIVPRFCS